MPLVGKELSNGKEHGNHQLLRKFWGDYILRITKLYGYIPSFPCCSPQVTLWEFFIRSRDVRAYSGQQGETLNPKP